MPWNDDGRSKKMHVKIPYFVIKGRFIKTHIMLFYLEWKKWKHKHLRVILVYFYISIHLFIINKWPWRARTPENGGTSYDVRDVMIVKDRLLRLLKNKQETIRYLYAKFYQNWWTCIFFCYLQSKVPTHLKFIIDIKSVQHNLTNRRIIMTPL